MRAGSSPRGRSYHDMSRGVKSRVSIVLIEFHTCNCDETFLTPLLTRIGLASTMNDLLDPNFQRHSLPLLGNPIYLLMCTVLILCHELDKSNGLKLCKTKIASNVSVHLLQYCDTQCFASDTSASEESCEYFKGDR